MSDSPSTPATTLLVVVLVASLPVGVAAQSPGDASPAERSETLEQADGGEPTPIAVVELVPEGVMAEGLTIGTDDQTTVAQTVATELGVSTGSVHVEAGDGTGLVEVRAANVSTASLRSALETAGLSVGDATLRAGVTEETRTRIRAVIEQRLSQFVQREEFYEVAGIQWSTVDGRQVLTVRVSAMTEPGVLADVLTTRSRVTVDAHVPTDGGRNVTLLESSDLATVGPVQEGRAGRSPSVTATLTEAAARNFSDSLQELEFTSDGVNACEYQDSPSDPGYCLFTRLDDDVVFAASLAPGLADLIESGGFLQNPTFVFTASNLSQAEELKTALESGILPAHLTVRDARTEQEGGSGDINGTETTGANDTDSTSTPAENGPGFTPVLALVALAGVVLLARP